MTGVAHELAAALGEVGLYCMVVVCAIIAALPVWYVARSLFLFGLGLLIRMGLIE